MASHKLVDALSRLGDRDREVLALRFGGDLSRPEVAALLGLTLAKVQQILSRLLRKLRAILDEAGYFRAQRRRALAMFSGST
jgi:RNA polymerase sigma factor (sigma-70 family)